MISENPRFIHQPDTVKSKESERTSVEELIIAEPHGLCKGAEAAIRGMNRILDIIDGRDTLHMHNPPLHNLRWLRELEQRNVRIHYERTPDGDWVWDNIPDEAPYAFPAHGASPADYQKAKEKKLLTSDLTCRLVTAEHNKVAAEVKHGRHVILFGKKGHPEPRGTMGVVPSGTVTLISSEDDLLQMQVDPEKEYAWANQTTQSTREILNLKALASEMIPGIRIAGRGQGCYATDDRQDAVIALAPEVDAFLVVTSEISNNGTNLVRRAEEAGIPAYLIQGKEDLAFEQRFGTQSGIKRVAITSAASTLETYLQEVVDVFRSENVIVRLQQREHREPNDFPLPGLNEEGFIARFGNPTHR